ncbi:MAG TPA: hypothetical protein VG963_19410 [Polyangiaceae bacterium]|nr:hypothetical protein [Polyangiaceae bacterium]
MAAIPDPTWQLLDVPASRPQTPDRAAPGAGSRASSPPLQLRAAGKHEEAEQEKSKLDLTAHALTDDDHVNARASLAAKKANAEASVSGNALKDQPHDETMAELQARWHNDHVHRTYRGGVDAGHAARTKELEGKHAARLANLAVEQRKTEQRKNNATVQATVAQLRLR